MDTIEILQIATYISIAVAVLGLGIAIFLFFFFKIPRVFAFMTGRVRAKEVRRMMETGEYNSDKDGEERFTDDMSTGNTGKTVEPLSGQTGAGKTAAEAAPQENSAADTVVLTPETEVLAAENAALTPETQVLAADAEKAADEAPAPAAEAQEKKENKDPYGAAAEDSAPAGEEETELARRERERRDNPFKADMGSHDAYLRQMEAPPAPAPVPPEVPRREPFVIPDTPDIPFVTPNAPDASEETVIDLPAEKKEKPEEEECGQTKVLRKQPVIGRFDPVEHIMLIHTDEMILKEKEMN